MSWHIQSILVLLVAVCLVPTIGADAEQALPDASPTVIPNDDTDSGDPPPGPQSAVRNDCPSLEELGYLQKPLTDVSLDIRLSSEIHPADCSRDLFKPFESHVRQPMLDRGELVFYWAANELSYRPLYFEDPLLERYGQVGFAPWQPATSAVRFAGTIPALPYKFGLDPPWKPVYSLGHYRPGSSVPELRYGFPWKWSAALLEVGSWTGLLLLLP